MAESDFPIAALDRAKLDLEREKLGIERTRTKWNAAAVGVPLITLAVTAATGVWNQHKQSQLAFSLKVAEIVMATDDPTVTKNKAKALSMLFPEHLAPRFAESFDQTSFSQTDVKREVVNLLVANPESALKVVRVWLAAYPDDAWLKPIEATLAESSFSGNKSK